MIYVFKNNIRNSQQKIKFQNDSLIFKGNGTLLFENLELILTDTTNKNCCIGITYNYFFIMKVKKKQNLCN